jgi:FkbM family methyltransferase
MTDGLSTVNYKSAVVRYRKETADEKVLSHSFDKDIFFPEVPEYRGSAQAVVIDIGAHIGTFSIHSLLSGKAGRVFALEPNRETFGILKLNVESNSLENQIHVFPIAISDKDGTAQLFLDAENWGHSITNPVLKDFEEVPCLKLSTFFRQQNIAGCDLLKLNCEGAEFQILLSADANLLRKIRLMIILYHEDLGMGRRTKELVGYLSENGFYIRVFRQSSTRGWIIAKNRGHYSGVNHIFVKSVFFVKNKLHDIKENFLRYASGTALWRFAGKTLKRNPGR